MDIRDLRVLALDDEPVLLEYLAAALGEKGITRVHLFENPYDAMTFLKESAPHEENFPHLALIDVHMAALSGEKFVAWCNLQAERCIKEMPIALLTSDPEGLLAQVALKLGAQRIFGKPFNFEAFFNWAQEAKVMEYSIFHQSRVVNPVANL